MGGTLTAIETGYIQREIQDAAYRAQQAVDAGAAVVVGVNRFADDAPSEVDGVPRRPGDRAPADRARARAARLAAAGRNGSAALAPSSRRRTTARTSCLPIVAAVEARATLGEIADALRRVFGEYQGEQSPS